MQMIWLVRVGIGLVILGSLVYVIGAALPRDHTATVVATYKASPTEIWAIVADPLAASRWRPEVTRVDMLPAHDGRPRFRETTSHGEMEYEIIEATAPTRLVKRITSTDLPYGGGWEWNLTPFGNGTTLSITERGFVKPPVYRFLSRFVFGHTASMKSFHKALAKRLNESVDVSVVSDGN